MAKSCKQGLYCWLDERGLYCRLLLRHFEAIFEHIKAGMQEGESEEEVNLNIEIPPHILQDVLDVSSKRKAEPSVDCHSCKTYVSAKAAETELKSAQGNGEETLED